MPKTRSTVDRATLEAASLEYLQNFAKRYRLVVSADKFTMIESILSYVERHGEEEQRSEAIRDSRPQSSASGPIEPPAAEMLRDAIVMMREMQQQQQQFMLQMMNKLTEQDKIAPVNQRSEGVRVDNNGASARAVSERTGSPHRLSPVIEHSVRSAENIQGGSATKWLATQIPKFGGSDQENVTAWVNRVDRVTLIHGASDGVVLLAASSKLTSFAKQWYDIQDGVVIESWRALKSELLKVLKDVSPFIRQCRRWNKENGTHTKNRLISMPLLNGL